MAFTEDRSVFFKTSDFAVTVRHVKGSVPASHSDYTQVNGILTTEYIELQLTQGYAPVFLCDKNSVAGIEQNDWIVDTENEVDYRVREWQPSGDGMITLVLEEQ